MYKVLLTTLLCIGLAYHGYAQRTEAVRNIRVNNTKAVYYGKTGRIADIVKQQSTRLTAGKKGKKNLPPNFSGRMNSKIKRPELEHQGADPLRIMNKRRQMSRGPLTPLVNIDGAEFGGSPSDPTGAAGLEHYVQAINGTFVNVYDKEDGTRVGGFDMEEVFWRNIGIESGGDPIILYDTEYDQWILTEFAPSSTAILLVAISEDSDPLGVYSLYTFATPNFPDYPKYAIWDNALVVTTNEGGTSELHQYFIERDAIMNSLPDVRVQRIALLGNTSTEAGFYVTTPVNWMSGPRPVDSTPMVVKINDSSWGQTDEDVLEVYSFNIDFDNSENTNVALTSIPTTPFDGFPCSESGFRFECVPQKDGGGLDAIPEVVMNVPQYRNFGTHESVVLSFVTDVTDGENLSGIRWMEIRKDGDADWALYQEGTHSPDSLDRYMSSIAIDAEGNIGLAYNASSEDEFVSMRFTARKADDPLGTMTYDETVVVDGSSEIVSGSRFGDYAHMTVDPVDGQTFWYTGEYAGASNTQTRIFSFKLADERTNDLAVVGIPSPSTSAAFGLENISAQVVNMGTAPATGFDIFWGVPGQTDTLEAFTFNGTLAPGDTLTHTFDTPVELDTLGAFDFRVFISEDDFADNNSLEKTVFRIRPIEAFVRLNAPKTLYCNDSTPLVLGFQLGNNGFDTLENVLIDIDINGSLARTVNWEGKLPRSQSDFFEESFVLPAAEEAYDFVATLREPNGGIDSVRENNSDTVRMANDPNMQQLNVNILHDRFPGEIAWTFSNPDDPNEVFYVESGYEAVPVTRLIEDFGCVPPNQCTRFTIFDSFGDGLNNDTADPSDDGTYEVVTLSDSVLASGGGNYGRSEATDFCLGEWCNLMVSVDVEDVTFDSLGSITLTATGAANYQYSIDSGATFQDSNLFDSLDVGTYDIFVTAGEGCEFRDTVSISPPLCNLTVGIESEDASFETLGSITITASGAPNFQYSIDNGVNFQDSAVFEGLAPDTYQIVVDAGFDCQFRDSVTIAAPTCNLQVVVDSEDATFEVLGAIRITASGAPNLQYSIDSGATFQVNPVFEGLNPGTYMVVVDAGFDCQFSETVTISAPSCNLVVEIDSEDATFEVLGSITIRASGAPNLRYSIDNGATFQDSAVFEGLTPDNYQVLVDAGFDCAFRERVTIAAPPCELVVEIQTEDVTDDELGSIEINASGAPNLQYSIDNGATFQMSDMFEGLNPGFYVVVVDAGFDCQFTDSVKIAAPPCELEVEIETEDVTDDELGSIEIDASGAPNLQYSIDNGATFQANDEFEGLNPGTYIVVVDAGLDCQFTETVIIAAPPCDLEVEIDSEDATGSELGSIEIEASGAPNLQYSIDSGATFQQEPVFENLAPGTYNVVVDAGFDCQFRESVEIEITTGLVQLKDGQLSISPNPTDDGLLQLSLTGHQNISGFLEIGIFNAKGVLIQNKKVSRYDDAFIGAISLYNSPGGVYFIRLLNVPDAKPIRVVKK